MSELNWLPAVVGLLGLAVTPLATYFLIAHKAQQEQLSSQRASAYVELADAVAQLTQVDSPQQEQALTRVTAAKARIAVYGSPQVIADLARASGDLSDPHYQAQFVKLVMNMRKHIGARTADSASVTRVLFDS